LVGITLAPLQAQTPPSLVQLAFPEVSARGDGPPIANSLAPLLLSYARTRGNPNAVEVVFSAPVSESTATNKANYAISPGVTVLSAALGTDASTVILTTSTITNGVRHTLTVNNLQDRSSPPVTLAANSQVFILKAQGLITRKVFTNIGANWLNKQPHEQHQVSGCARRRGLVGQLGGADQHGRLLRRSGDRLHSSAGDG
jgi:hypothetical protein